MTTNFVMLVLAIIALLALARLLKPKGKRDTLSEPWPFYPRRLLTPPEQVLYHRLVKALPDNIVLAQVQVSRVLGVKKGSNFHEWNNRIDRLSYDFVVCSRDATVLAAIELDDGSHEAAARMATDNKKSKATTDAGIKIIRWHVKSLPDAAAIQAELRLGQGRIKPSLSPPPKP